MVSRSEPSSTPDVAAGTVLSAGGPNVDSPTPEPPKTPVLRWILAGAFLLVIVLVVARVLGGTMIFVSLIAGVIGCIAIARGGISLLGIKSRGGAIGVLVGAFFLLVLGGGVNAAQNPATIQAAAPASQLLQTEQETSAPTPTESLTPAPTPSPIAVAEVPDYSTLSATAAQVALVQAGFTVQVRSVTGQEVPDMTGWTVSGQSVLPGTELAKGSTVFLVLEPPAPAPVVEAPAPAAPAPAPPAPVAPGGGATALCNDGTYSYAAHHQGACSHHHGVAVFYK